jgi:hypothetical protein
MALGKTFKPIAGVFATKTLKGLVSASIASQGTTVTQRADGAVSLTKAYREGIHHVVTLTAEVNESIKDITDGLSGALVLTYREQIPGANLGSEAAARTITMPATGKGVAVCTGVSDSVGVNGNPQVTITLIVTADTGLPADLYTITDA